MVKQEKTYRYWLPSNNNERIDRSTAENSVIIIGPNGSGKSKLGAWIESQDYAAVHRISAQRNINFSETIPLKSFHAAEENVFWGDPLYKNDKNGRWGFGKNLTTTLLDDFDDVLSALIAQYNLESNKFLEACNNANKNKEPYPLVPKTTLEVLYEIWNQIFPQRMLKYVDGTFYAFDPHNELSKYAATQMSDGERSVLYLAAQVLCLPKNKIIIMDEPEVHLHRSLMKTLWCALEEARTDCLFIFITHDVDFASIHSSSDKIWIKNFDGTHWEWEDVPDSELPKELVIELLGNRRKVLFVEGDKNSIDYRLYSLLYDDYYVVPCGGCEQVISNTRAFRKTFNLHGETAFGIIDRDYKTKNQLDGYKQDGIYTLGVAEIENLFLTEELIATVASRFACDQKTVWEQIQNYVYDRFKKQLESQIRNSTIAKAKLYLASLEIPKTYSEDDYQPLDKIDLAKMERKERQRFEEVLNGGVYRDVIKVFNDKSISKTIGQFFGIDNKVYIDKVIALAESEMNEAIKRALAGYLPELI